MNTTLPSIAELTQWFNYFNQRFFFGKLPIDIKIEYSSRQRAMGDWSRKYNRIRITDKYILTKKQYQEILIHEMIHAYETHVLRKKCGHGMNFKAKAHMINHESNYNITTRFNGELILANEKLIDDKIILVFKVPQGYGIVKTNDKYFDRELTKCASYHNDVKAFRIKGSAVERLAQRSVNSYRYYIFSPSNYNNLINNVITEISLMRAR